MKETTASSQYTLNDGIRILFKHLPSGLVFLVVVIGLTIFSLGLMLPTYEVTTRIMVSSEQKKVFSEHQALQQIRNSQPRINQGEMVTSNRLLRKVVMKLNLPDRQDKYDFYPSIKKVVEPYLDQVVEIVTGLYNSILNKQDNPSVLNKIDQTVNDLKRAIKIHQIPDSDIFAITVSDYNPQMAARIANAIVHQFMIVNVEQQLINLKTKYGNKHPVIKQLTDTVNKLKKKSLSKHKRPVVMNTGIGTVQIIEPAISPVKPVKPRKRLTLLMAVAFGCVGAFCLAFILEGFDQTVKHPWEFEQITGINVIQAVPQKRLNQLIINWKKIGSQAYHQAYQRLAERLFLLTKQQKMKRFLFCDFQNRFNAERNALNVAALFSRQYGLKTLVLDMNFRNQARQKLLRKIQLPIDQSELKNNLGLIASVNKVHDKLDIIVLDTCDKDPLVMATDGALDKFVGELAGDYDVVCCHAASLMHFQDARYTAAQTEGVVLSINEGEVRKEALKFYWNGLKTPTWTICGAVFNDRSYPIPSFIYKRL